MRAVRRIIKAAFAIWLATAIFVVGFALLWPRVEPPPQSADLIVVLGGGMSASGALHRSSTVRVDRAVALFHAGVADRLHFTGGVARRLSAGEAMAQRAERMGVPRAAISVEGQSQSTLQNALFSRSVFRAANHTVLVTEAFHLPRSWASFKVFGAGDLSLIHAPNGRDGPVAHLRMILRETLAIWFNVARFGLWWLVGLTDTDGGARDALLPNKGLSLPSPRPGHKARSFTRGAAQDATFPLTFAPSGCSGVGAGHTQLRGRRAGLAGRNRWANGDIHLPRWR